MLLLVSGCVVPPRQLSTSDAVADVSDSVQPEAPKETPDDICPKQQECPVLQQKSTKGYWIAISVLSVACVALAFGLYKQYQKTVQWHNLCNASYAKSKNTETLSPAERKSLQDEITRLRGVMQNWQRRERELLQIIEHPEEDSLSPYAIDWRFCKKELAKCKETINKWSAEVQRLVGILNYHGIDVQSGNKK
jgi:hypothetical protein